MARVFITGATGFIGSTLARQLVAAGHHVTALARTPPAPGGELEWVRGDLASDDGLDRASAAVRTSDIVFHLAAVRKDHTLTDDQLARVNVTGGVRLLELAESASRFVLVSSVAVYGHPEGGKAATEGTPFRPSKRYGHSKVAAEEAVEAAAARLARPLVILRPGIVYGPGDSYGMVANVARLLARRRFLVVGSGSTQVNALYVDDCARAMVLAMTAAAAIDEDFLVVGDRPIPIRELIATIAAAVGVAVPGIAVPESLARAAARGLGSLHLWFGLASEPFLTRAKIDLFTRDDIFDGGKARALLGFSPTTTLAEGCRQTVAWMRAAGLIAR